ncbi:MAG: hypothetical protein IJ298_07580 [Ruminococcus sp.]|nr:hypothetical protein [Ruminococcus sp.]
MNKDKIKKWSVRAGIIFLAVVALLTYFSDSIDTMLLPKVKVTQVIADTLTGEKDPNPNATHYIVPLSAITIVGNSGILYAVKQESDCKGYVYCVNAAIEAQDELYCQITSSDTIFNGQYIIYSTSKEIAQGSRVYIEEGVSR